MYYKIILLIALFASLAAAQSPNTIKQRCQSPFGSTYGRVQITAVGDINVNPCPTKSTIFTGNVILPSGSGAISGSGTTNFVPRWTAASVLGNTPFSWNGTTYRFDNTALNANFIQTFIPSAAGTGSFFIGQAGVNSFNVHGALNTISNQVNAVGGVWNVTDAADFSLIFNATTNIFTALDTGTSFGLALDGSNGEFTIGDGTTIFTVNAVGATPTFSFTNGIIEINSDCAGRATLDGSGTFDLSTTTCFALADSPPIILVTSASPLITGVLSVTPLGLLESSAGAGDTGQEVNYWIIDTP